MAVLVAPIVGSSAVMSRWAVTNDDDDDDDNDGRLRFTLDRGRRAAPLDFQQAYDRSTQTLIEVEIRE